MSDEPAGSVALADAVSDLLYAIAGWLLIGMGLLSAWFAVGYALNDQLGHPVGIAAQVLLAIVLVAAGVFVNPRFRRRLDRRHALSTFGRVHSVDERTVGADEDCDERCVRCDAPVDRGLVRRRRAEHVIAGVPVYTADESANYYCLDCATDEVGVAADENNGVNGEPAEKNVETGSAS